MQHQNRGRTGRPTRWPALIGALVVLVGSAAAATVASANTSGSAAETIKVALITKDVTNPFFVKMKQGATAQAKKLGPSFSTPRARAAPTTPARSPRSRTW